jgi:hypothetical protein
MIDRENTVKKLMSLIGIVGIAALGSAGTAQADHKPGHAAPAPGPTPSLSLKSDTPVVRYNRLLTPPGGAATLSGRLMGADNAARVIVLEQNPAPLADNVFEPTSYETTTDAKGDFRFTGVVTAVNSQFRALTKGGGPQTTSTPADVKVRPQVSRRVSDATPSSGERVRFRGRIWPEHDGQPVSIQRRGSDGRYRTVRRTTARDVVGQVYSRYSVRVRVRTTGVYRVVVRPTDGDHLNGYSRARKLRVG